MNRVSTRFAVVGVVLSIIGAFALVVGSHDVFAARGLGSRLFGALLAAAGLIMLIAATGVVRRAAWHVALSLVGSFAALLVGLALLLAQWDVGGRSGELLVWLGVVVASMTALVLSLGQGASEVSKAVRRVQLVAVAGMVIGVAQFAFTTVYGPTVAGPHMTLTSTLEPVGEKAGFVAVKARITLDNTGDRKIVVVDSLYRVVGQRVVGEEKRGNKDEFSFVDELGRAAAAGFPGLDNVAATQGADESRGAVVRAGQLTERGFWFEPGESLTSEFVVHAPSGRYDLLRLAAELTIADHGLLDLGDKPVLGPKIGAYSPDKRLTVLETKWEIRETSWVRRMVRGDNVLWSRWLLAGPGELLLPYMLAYVDERDATFDPWQGKPVPGRVVRLTGEYGVISTYTRAELSLFPGASE